jgi:hypothetical protein
MSLPRVYEKKWPSVILTPISVANHIVTVPSVLGLHVKQIVVLLATGEDPQEFEIKRILSETQLRVGPKDGGRMNEYSNPIQFNGGTLAMSEQNRNPMASEIVLRAVYEEEPAVALRTILIDRLGDYYSVDNPVPVQVINTTGTNLDPLITNIPVPLAATEQSFTFPLNTRKFLMKVRGGYATVRLSYVAGETATNWLTMDVGCEYTEENGTNYGGKTVYFRLDKPSKVMEILTWAG